MRVTKAVQTIERRLKAKLRPGPTQTAYDNAKSREKIQRRPTMPRGEGGWEVPSADAPAHTSRMSASRHFAIRRRTRTVLFAAAVVCAPAACARATPPAPPAPRTVEPMPAAPDFAPGPLDRLFQVPTSRFIHVSSTDTTGGNADRWVVAPGDSVVLLDLDGPGVVRSMWMTIASRDPDYLRRISLEMYWDGEANPSVEAPLGDFFGDGFNKPNYASLVMGVTSGGFFTYLPMPFARHARIVARNGTGRAIDAFYFNADVELVDSLPTPLATFHAWWHRDPRTTSHEPHLILDAHGAGWFVGTSLDAESLDGSLSFLEGDERYFVDGSFRGQGTGTEDYFNSGWYFDRGTFAAPFHGLVVKDEKRGRIAAYRWHLLDPIPFRDSIRVDIEHGTGNSVVADYATMAYWYQTEPHTPLPPLPPPDERKVMGVRIPAGARLAKDLEAAPIAGGWELDLPVPRPDRYQVVAYPSGGPDAGVARVSVAGGPVRRIRLAAEEPATVLDPVVLDTVAARTSVRMAWLAGVMPAAVEIRPVRRFAVSWSVVGPFPNPQRLGTEISPALDSVYGPERDPDLTRTYEGEGGRTVRWTPVEARANGYVNLNAIFEPNDWVAAYAEAFLYSPDDRDAVLLLGADDAHVMWVNGRVVSRRQGRHISTADDLEVDVRLHAGWNRVLLKVADLDGGWAFQLRAADPHGVLRWAPSPSGAKPAGG